MTHERRFTIPALLVALVVVTWVTVPAGPPIDRTFVAAVADDTSDRILVRWRIVDGPTRHSHFHVLRREATATEFEQLNDDPVGALATVAAIQAEFTAPGRGDALQQIQDDLGPDYAEQILDADPQNEILQLQRALLPEVNYVAAVVLGRGFIDETAVNGTTYLYEVWGADAEGFPEERIGRASATAGSPDPLPAPDQVTCAEISGGEAHGRAFLRFEEPALDQPFFGYDVYRAPRNPDETCPPVGPGQPGSVRANDGPVMGDAPGQSAQGEALFHQANSCSSCHAGGRDLPIDQNGVQFTRIQDFRRRQFPAINAGGVAPHDTPFLNALADEDIRAVYDYIQEFQLTDDGSGAPGEPFDLETTYCYAVATRNLFGDPGTVSAAQQCRVRDQRAPRAPGGLESARIDQGGFETCNVSWARNVAADDDTAQYRIYRVDFVPQLSKDVDTDCDPVCDEQIVIVQPGAGDRVEWTDPALAAVDAGRTFFYSVVAEDSAGDGGLQTANRSSFSGWVPCTPRDNVAPPSGNLTVDCCTAGLGCEDKGLGAEWRAAGGVTGYLVTDPTLCPPEIHYDFPGDTFRFRLFTSVTGESGDYRSGPDHDNIAQPDYSPSLTTKVYWKAKGFDKSTNFSPFSNPISVVLQGKEALPVPQILSVELLSLQNKEVKIRFRGLNPNQLLGYALYEWKSQKYDDIGPPDNRGVFNTRYPNATLSTEPLANDPFQWAVLVANPDALADHLPAQKPANGPYLFFEQQNEIYELVTNLNQTHSVLLYLAAIDWAGGEGPGRLKLWDGWNAFDDFLDWPEHRRDNDLPDGIDVSLNVTELAAALRVEWTPQPQVEGEVTCFQGDRRPFVVYRRRQGAQKWQQISPLFVCTGDPLGGVIGYEDADVEDGLYYTYGVVRLDPDGEFDVQYNTTTQCFGTCVGPPPE